MSDRCPTQGRYGYHENRISGSGRGLKIISSLYDETFYIFASFEVTTALILEDPDLL